MAVVIDLFSRYVIGWSMQNTMKRNLVVDSLKMALARRRPVAGLLHHSDRGSQYASNDYQTLLKGAGMIPSMSRKGNCWDNAPTESFFGTLKKELVHRRQFNTRLEARSTIFWYIEAWYNRQRRHSSLGYVSPIEYELQKAPQLIETAA